MRSFLWTLDDARMFCYDLHDHLLPLGYDVGLAGGCLLRGKSDKDIDVIIYPLKRLFSNFELMKQSLPNFGLKFIGLPNNNIGYIDDGKCVEIWEYDGKRVDLLFLS